MSVGGLALSAAPAQAYNYRNCSFNLYSASYFTAYTNCDGALSNVSIYTIPAYSSTSNYYNSSANPTTIGQNVYAYGGESYFYVGGFVLNYSARAPIVVGCNNTGGNNFHCVWQYS